MKALQAGSNSQLDERYPALPNIQLFERGPFLLFLHEVASLRLIEITSTTSPNNGPFDRTAVASSTVVL